MKTIPLVRARFPRLFAEALRVRGVPVETHLAKAHIPAESLEDDTRPLSMHSVIRFLESAIRDPELGSLGLLAGDIAIREPGLLEVGACQAQTLYRAIDRFRTGTRALFSRADVYLTRQGDTAWLCRKANKTPREVGAQFELLLVRTMLHVMRNFMGGDWRPAELRLQYADQRVLLREELFGSVDLKTGYNVTAIAFPVSALSRQRVEPVPVSTAEELGPLLERDPLETLRGLLSDCAAHKTPRVETAAEMCGLSTRTLGRHLSALGVSFRHLIDDIRFSRAVRLLKDEKITITDVAFDVGYSDVAHFSRAFRRRAGIPPREYRRQLSEAAGLP